MLTPFEVTRKGCRSAGAPRRLITIRALQRKVTRMSTEGNTADSMRKATENLDHSAGAAPSSEYLDKVGTDDFGRSDDTVDDENREDDEKADEEDASTPSADR